MAFHRYNIAKWCRWCGKAYMAVRPIGKDGFCSAAHKQAHYRAYKKYVTAKRGPAARARGRQVTHKKKKNTTKIVSKLTKKR